MSRLTQALPALGLVLLVGAGAFLVFFLLSRQRRRRVVVLEALAGRFGVRNVRPTWDAVEAEIAGPTWRGTLKAVTTSRSNFEITTVEATTDNDAGSEPLGPEIERQRAELHPGISHALVGVVPGVFVTREGRNATVVVMGQHFDDEEHVERVLTLLSMLCER
ncbi:MAG: hypothetical protein JNL21_02950 [Myxococcales bacterium]|nr:hypothetical protein [Myxococcales bacterium]